jgi:hypothetical protein
MKCTEGRGLRLLVCLQLFCPSPVISDVRRLKMVAQNPYETPKPDGGSHCESTHHLRRLRPISYNEWQLMVSGAAFSVRLMALQIAGSASRPTCSRFNISGSPDGSVD